MQKWKYKVIDLIKETKKTQTESRIAEHWLRAPDLEEVLNKLGAQGWELVNIHFLLNKEVIVGFFKRPV